MTHKKSPTFGHRYLAISFIIAQSAFRCSLFDTVCSAKNASVFGGALVFGATGCCTLSGFTLSAKSTFGVTRFWGLCCVSLSRLDLELELNVRRLDCLGNEG